jgi:hypothetical protein
MPSIVLEDLTEEQEVLILAFINEGKLRAYEEILSELERENMANATEDPYYGYYVQHLIEKVNSLYVPLKESVDG